METWVKCEEGPWFISNQGNMRFDNTVYHPHLRGQPIKFRENINGYHFTSITDYQGHRVNIILHILVAKYFLGAKPEGCEIHHRNEDKSDNRADNLAYVTHFENCRRHQIKHRKHRLSPADVREIVEANRIGIPIRQLGRMYGVSHQTICAIIHKKMWRTVTCVA
jgi:hypothetical protein